MRPRPSPALARRESLRCREPRRAVTARRARHERATAVMVPIKSALRTAAFGESHGYADAGLELARANHSPGRRRERNRPEGAAAAGAELDLEPARDASAAGASGAALFDARRGLARIWRCGAPASRLDARGLCRLPGFSSDIGGGASPRHHRRRPRRDLRPRARRGRAGGDGAACSDRADLARTVAHDDGRAAAVLRTALPPRPSSRAAAVRLWL